jgi:hypothetical protein
VVITGEARDGIPLVSGVTFTAEVIRPDDTRYALTLNFDENSEQYVGTLPVSEFRGRGGYQVVGRCEVSASATTHQGELFGDPRDKADQQVGRPARAFSRTSSRSFILYVEEPAAIPTTGPRAGDCDLDGIPNLEELPGDFDGDGLEDALIVAPGASADAVWYSTLTGIDRRGVTVNGSYAIATGPMDRTAPGISDDVLFVSASSSHYLWQGDLERSFLSTRVG